MVKFIMVFGGTQPRISIDTNSHIGNISFRLDTSLSLHFTVFLLIWNNLFDIMQTIIFHLPVACTELSVLRSRCGGLRVNG